MKIIDKIRYKLIEIFNIKINSPSVLWVNVGNENEKIRS